jgi:hypothetical protein
MQYAVSVDVLHTVSKLGKYYSNMPHDLVWVCLFCADYD